MSFDAFPQYPPVDGELVDRIVCKLKSQGIFDQFRKDCLADVDTKPAYQNLQQRVNGTVATFLATQTWQQDLNKTQLRESLRRHVQQGFLEVGVDRIVDQVVNPKVFTVFMPKVEDVVYDCLGIEKPKHPPPSNNLLSGRKLTLLDLLPKDLDPVSPDSDNLSFGDDETKDETNNNESSSKLDISHDSQVSGISDLSSHMGDSFKEAQENHIDSNTAKSIASAKENSTEPHFDNFENLSEKIKQAEIGGHNSATSPLPEEQDNSESKVTLEVDQDLQKDSRDETLMEIDSISNSTFEDARTLTNKLIKDDTCSRTLSEDSLSCSSFNTKFKKDKSKSVIVGNSENSMDKSEVDTPCKELFSDKEVKISSINDDVDIKNEEKVTENKEAKKTEEPKDKKQRDSSSSKTSKSSRPSDSKHRSSSDKKGDIKQNKEKTYKEEKDKEKSSKDDKDRSSRHKDDRHHSSKDKYKDKERNDKSREKDSDKKKDKSDYKDLSEKDKKNDKDKHKDRDKNDKDKARNDKENHKYEKDKSRSEKDRDRHEKEKDKDKHEKTRRDKDKEKREKDKNDSKEKDKDRNDNEKEKCRERDRGKSEKDYKNEKDKESRTVDDKARDEKRRDSKKYDKSSSSSSTKKDDNNKSKEEINNEKTFNSKSAKNEDEKRERKRKSERCNDEIKLKEARRSWDRDSSGGNGKGHGSHKSNNSEYKVNSSTSSTKEKRTGESSNQQKGNERRMEPDGDMEEPSDVDKILMKINSSIEESQNIQSNDEQAIKKPKIARNIFEIRKIMQARKNIARQAFKKRKEMMDSVEEVDITNSPSTAKPPTRDNCKTREENKENIKTEQMDKLKNTKSGPVKGKFNGFLESDIEQSRNSLQIFRAHFSNFCTSMGMELLPTENIEKIDFSKICDLSDDLLDDNLNKLKPKSVSLERKKTLPDEKQVSKAVENIMNGKNGCYVLLKDCCTEVVEAMRNTSQPPLNKSTKRPIPSKPQPSSAIDEDFSKSNSGKNVRVLDRSSKKETLSSPVKPVSQCLDTVASEVTEIISRTSQQQQLIEQVSSAKKSAVRTPPTRQQSTEDKEEEPFSPVADLTIALNTYLNDSKEILPSVPLTEAMLDNLMQQSSIILEDETFADSDDSMHESESVIKPVISAESNFNIEESSVRTSGDVYYSSDVDHSDDATMPRSKKISNVIDSSTCDIFSHNKDSNEETSEIKVVKRRNQRVCRSASQRYDSTDLYKPRPVLPQNSKRVRTPRSVSSEEASTREQYECTPSRKRAR